MLNKRNASKEADSRHPIRNGTDVNKIIIQQPDLDTCLTAIILGAEDISLLDVRLFPATSSELSDPEVVCIEAGGSGRTSLNNFDHHDPERYFPPACRQALEYSGKNSHLLERLTDYVCRVDECREMPAIPFPSLSALFSGMRLCTPNPVNQFHAGLNILRIVIDKELDPFATMPERPEWQEYLSAKRRDFEKKARFLKDAVLFTTRQETRVGFMQVPLNERGGIGGFQELYQRGCAIGILFHPAFGEPPVRKFTIAGNDRPVSLLLPYLNPLEPGWGGRETIIGSPRTGSILETNQIRQLVEDHL